MGLGGAGAGAAITAHDLGARVLVIEKQPRSTHCTNTAMSGGVFINVSAVQQATAYMEALCRTTVGGPVWTDHKVIDAWASYSAENVTWLESLGGKIGHFATGGTHEQLPGAESIVRYRFAGSGLAMQRFLTAQVESRGIRIVYEARAKHLLTNLNGEVEGVRAKIEADGGSESTDIRAHRGVILTCGGFEFDEEMKLNYLRVYPTHFTGSPANTGDGVRMAQGVGAQLWHMNCCAGDWVAKFPDYPSAFVVDLWGDPWVLARRPSRQKEGWECPGFIMVDRDGKRFTSENYRSHSTYYELALYDSHRLIYPRVPCHWIFDQKRATAGRLSHRIGGAAGPVGLYSWGEDIEEEVAIGRVVRADSIAELAEKLGLPSDSLDRTVSTWNSYCEAGRDPEFARRPSDLVPLRNPPYYGMRLYPGGPNTQGGPRRNERALVLKTDGHPIPRLYSAGELGSPFGMLYPSGGGNLSDCIAFGRIAAEGVCQETPRS
ncbi:MAG: FAD-binding protein [Dehalococcoidia bacterium]|nr:FAD-binding protein [Dehalococcoidia bacterium]